MTIHADSMHGGPSRITIQQLCRSVGGNFGCESNHGYKSRTAPPRSAKMLQSASFGGRLNKILGLSHGSDPVDRSNDGWKVWGLRGLIATPGRGKIHLLVLLGGH